MFFGFSPYLLSKILGGLQDISRGRGSNFDCLMGGSEGLPYHMGTHGHDTPPTTAIV